MSKIRLFGDTSGYVDISAPAVADNRNIDLPTVLDSKLDLAGGKILQIVRATDSTQRTTTSSSFVDVTGMSVTITPQKSDSAIIIISTCWSRMGTGSGSVITGQLQITDAGNNAISGAQQFRNAVLAGGASSLEIDQPVALIAYATPATTSAVTYKLRFLATTGTHDIYNNLTTGQMYAIEVSA